jgi:hypothetical protein
MCDVYISILAPFREFGPVQRGDIDAHSRSNERAKTTNAVLSGRSDAPGM